jgi:peroxiredoxin
MKFRYIVSSLVLSALLSACGEENTPTDTASDNAVSSDVYTPKHGAKLINQAAPEFSLANMTDGQLALSDYKGKAVLINFWATWCAPCKEEIPDFEEVYKELSNKDFTVLGIALDEKEKVAEYIKKLGMTYPVAYGDDDVDRITKQYGNTIGALPYNVVLDKQHRIIYAEPGLLPKERLLQLVEPML